MQFVGAWSVSALTLKDFILERKSCHVYGGSVDCTTDETEKLQ